MYTKDMKLSSTKELNTFTNRYPDWKLNKANTRIAATYTFGSHIDALTFVMRVTIHAQIKQHHPDITFTYGKVQVKLTTHDAGGLTKKDIQLAKVIHGLYQHTKPKTD